MRVSRADIEKFSSDLKDKLPADVTGASAKVDVSFEDVATTCPTDKGNVPGKLRGKGSITVKVERSGGPPIEVKLSADVDTTYIAKIGADGKVSAINGVEVQTKFQTGGSGTSTQTYRGRVLGTGFGKDGILDAPAGRAGAAIERDSGHIDPNSGGVFGPHGSWRYGRPFPISDLRTLDNVKAMAATSIATNVLTLASLEYLRKVTLDRIEKSPCGYYVLVDITSRTVTAGYQAFGKLYFTVVARAVSGSATRWTGTAPALFTDLSFTAKSECAAAHARQHRRDIPDRSRAAANRQPPGHVVGRPVFQRERRLPARRQRPALRPPARPRDARAIAAGRNPDDLRAPRERRRAGDRRRDRRRWRRRILPLRLAAGRAQQVTPTRPT